jgi:hypothetical protein
MSNHLDYIQNTINRMSHNSFLIKGWTITFISLLFILAVNNSNQSFLILSLLPLICFWILDAYYLRQERLFRELYNHVRKDNTADPFSMDTRPFEDRVDNWLLTLFSPTIAIVYISIIFLNVLLQLLVIRGVI